MDSFQVIIKLKEKSLRGFASQTLLEGLNEKVAAVD